MIHRQVVMILQRVRHSLATKVGNISLLRYGEYRIFESGYLSSNLRNLFRVLHGALS